MNDQKSMELNDQSGIPETAAVAERDNESFCYKCYHAGLRLLQHGATMERQRDEAREDAKRATYDAAQETIKVSTVKSHWIEACRERDEAREQLRLANIDCFAALTELDAAQKYADAAMFERDQLRMRVAELQNGIVVEAAK